MPPDVRLRSSDGAVFTASAEASRLSPLISYAVDHLQDDQEIPIPNVRGEILEMVLRYLEYHAAEHGDAEAQSWDNSFIDTGSVSVLIDIIQAALYLDVGCLHALGCRQVARMIRIHSDASLRSAFGIAATAHAECDPAWRYVP